jgi:hypothetical protein
VAGCTVNIERGFNANLWAGMLPPETVSGLVRTIAAICAHRLPARVLLHQPPEPVQKTIEKPILATGAVSFFENRNKERFEVFYE